MRSLIAVAVLALAGCSDSVTGPELVGASIPAPVFPAAASAPIPAPTFPAPASLPTPTPEPTPEPTPPNPTPTPTPSGDADWSAECLGGGGMIVRNGTAFDAPALVRWDRINPDGSMTREDAYQRNVPAHGSVTFYPTCKASGPETWATRPHKINAAIPTTLSCDDAYANVAVCRQ